MALTKTTQYANRKGLDFKIYAFPKTENAEPLLTVDYVNECSLDLTSGMVWATGGKSHANRISFNDPMEGTFTISTQIMTPELMALIAGKDMSSFTAGEIVFNNNDENKFYVIEGDTVWKDKDSVIYTETVKCYKASPEKAFNITYTGEGDPNSVDITFNLAEDEDGNVYASTMADQTSGG